MNQGLLAVVMKIVDVEGERMQSWRPASLTLEWIILWRGAKQPVIKTLKELVTTIDHDALFNGIMTAQWEGVGDVESARYEPGPTSPMPDHKGFKLQ